MNLALELERTLEFAAFVASRPAHRARLGASSHEVINRQGTA